LPPSLPIYLAEENYYRISCRINGEDIPPPDECFEECGECEVNVKPLIIVFNMDVSGSMRFSP
jgi:hypothetical protein